MSVSSITPAITPAIAGAAQVIVPPDDGPRLRGPIELMVSAARAAAQDAGSPALLERVGWIGVAAGTWPIRDPGERVAAQLRVHGAHARQSTISGTGPQDLLGAAAAAIAAGEVDVALVVGGEANWSQRQIRRAGGTPPWTAGEEPLGIAELTRGFPPETIAELVGTLRDPVVAYALFEDGLRVAAGRTVDEQRDRAATLWARFAGVAAGNPFAWDRSAPTAAAIREESPDNRMIAFPYPKAMVANNTVDLASAVLLVRADRPGLDRGRLVYPLVSTAAHETWQVAARDVLHASPALAAAGRAAFDHTGTTPDDVDHVELYACFPSIVQMSAAALDLSADRQLTVTGGLGFAGAALTNAVGHAIAAIVPLVRAGGTALVHGNGGMATKQAFGLYGPEPTVPFARLDVQDRTDLRPRAVAPAGTPGRVEAATVVHDRTGPTHLVAALRTDDDARLLTTSRDRDLMAAAVGGTLTGALLG